MREEEDGLTFKNLRPVRPLSNEDLLKGGEVEFEKKNEEVKRFPADSTFLIPAVKKMD